jgi:hypothetical protein
MDYEHQYRKYKKKYHKLKQSQLTGGEPTDIPIKLPNNHIVKLPIPDINQLKPDQSYQKKYIIKMNGEPTLQQIYDKEYSQPKSQIVVQQSSLKQQNQFTPSPSPDTNIIFQNIYSSDTKFIDMLREKLDERMDKNNMYNSQYVFAFRKAADKIGYSINQKDINKNLLNGKKFYPFYLTQLWYNYDKENNPFNYETLKILYLYLDGKFYNVGLINHMVNEMYPYESLEDILKRDVDESSSSENFIRPKDVL